MIYEPEVPRLVESGESRDEHVRRKAREQRAAHMEKIQQALFQARHVPQNNELLAVVELLVEFVDDLSERPFL